MLMIVFVIMVVVVVMLMLLAWGMVMVMMITTMRMIFMTMVTRGISVFCLLFTQLSLSMGIIHCGAGRNGNDSVLEYVYDDA